MKEPKFIPSKKPDFKYIERNKRMMLNPPKKVRAIIYGLNVLGSPIMAYLLARGIIGTLEVSLWAAEMSAAFALAGLNVTSKEDK